MTITVLSAAAAVLASWAMVFAVPQGPAPAQPAPSAPSAPRDDSAAERLGWELGMQAWTFRDRTAIEAIETAGKLGLKYIELYPGQALAPGEPKAEVGPALTAAQIEALKKKLQGAGVKAVSYGVVSLKNDEAAARKQFEFVKGMGMRTLVTEPTPDARDMVSRLADEYNVLVAIHNHPKPSMYWNPDTVLEAIKGRSPLMGACADTGHWPRSGLRSIDSLKKIEGHVIELHFKDITNGRDAVWGTGDSDAKGMLAELKRQGFRGQIYVEYEFGSGKELEANVARCIEFFDRAARELGAEPAAAPAR